MNDARRPLLFPLTIVDGHGEIFRGEAEMVSVKSELGELGILARHTPLLARLFPGPVRVKLADGEELPIYVSGGLMEVHPEGMTILADTALRGNDIDEAAARQAKAAAEEAVRTSVLYQDRDRAQLELIKALAQLKTIEFERRRRNGR